MSERMSVMISRYGNRDMFAPGNPVLRPSGSMFIQGDLSTYIRTESLDPVFPSSFTGQPGPQEIGVSGDYLARKVISIPGGGLTAARLSQPGAQDDAVHYEPLPDRTVYREKWVERVYLIPGGREVVLRRLRHSSEGRGGRA